MKRQGQFDVSWRRQWAFHEVCEIHVSFERRVNPPHCNPGMVAVLIHHEVKSSAVLGSRPCPECTTVNNWFVVYLPNLYFPVQSINSIYCTCRTCAHVPYMCDGGVRWDGFDCLRQVCRNEPKRIAHQPRELEVKSLFIRS